MSALKPYRFRRARWVLPLLLVAGLGVWLSFRHSESTDPVKQPLPVPVRVAPVARTDFSLYITALGNVTALNTITLRSRVNGELQSVLFREGVEVKPGEVLAIIDPRPYVAALQQAQGSLQQNQAQLHNAEIDLKRYRGLYADDSVAKQTLDTQEAQVSQLQGLVRSSQAQVTQAQLNLDYTRITAPLAGRIGLRQLDAGNLVSADSTPIASITQLHPISVTFSVPEIQVSDILRARQAQPNLTVEAWDRDERHRLATGQLESLDNQIDPATGTLKLKAQFSNTDDSLYPNQFVNVRLQLGVLQGALLVPNAAVQRGAQGTFAFVVDTEHRARLRRLETGPSDANNTVILQGLNADEQVVLEGTDRLREDSVVEVVGSTSLPSAVSPEGS